MNRKTRKLHDNYGKWTAPVAEGAGRIRKWLFPALVAPLVFAIVLVLVLAAVGE